MKLTIKIPSLCTDNAVTAQRFHPNRDAIIKTAEGDTDYAGRCRAAALPAPRQPRGPHSSAARRRRYGAATLRNASNCLAFSPPDDATPLPRCHV